ncbi:hypothetical protein LA080_008059 [Diaporthe eres]|nr:hypothetical protein LA080_008059 [Diaporthe eres]
MSSLVRRRGKENAHSWLRGRPEHSFLVAHLMEIGLQPLVLGRSRRLASREASYPGVTSGGLTVMAWNITGAASQVSKSLAGQTDR